MAVLSSRAPGGALGRRCLPHTGTLRAWAPGQRGCRCALLSQGPRSPSHRQVLRGTWRPCACLCAALGPSTSSGGAARVLPDARRTAAGSACQGAHPQCLPSGEDPRDTGVPLTFSVGEKSLRSQGCASENRGAQLSSLRQLAATITLPLKLSRRRKSLQRVFLAPLGPPSRLRPGLQQIAGNQRSRSAYSRVHLLHPLVWAACPR